MFGKNKNENQQMTTHTLNNQSENEKESKSNIMINHLTEKTMMLMKNGLKVG